jgi:hypothetical protein
MFGYFLCPIMQTAFLLGRSRCVGVKGGGGVMRCQVSGVYYVNVY